MVLLLFLESELINQERGVSVRLGIHGLEILVGEAERTRTLNHQITPIPRFSDFHALEQIAKFELSEMDDTIENRTKIFNEMIDESIKETSLTFFDDVEENTLQSIKEEFGQNTFQVSQHMVWKNGQSSYSNQIEKFSTLKNLIEQKLKFVEESQQELLQKISSYEISSQRVTFSESDYDELRSFLTEILLEGMCWVTPKILDKREAGYVSA